ncbi:MAG: hypothetical protein KA383_06975 [Phycisphaerae bacterium]|nr:hypothetical protein [Phycisphaerae bacterium]
MVKKAGRGHLLARDFLQRSFELAVAVVGKQRLPAGEFEQRAAFLRRAACDHEEVPRSAFV